MESIDQPKHVRGLNLRFNSKKRLDVATESIYIILMKFIWDEAKNAENIKKHGIDFNDAKEIFQFPYLDGPDQKHDYGEDRWIAIGLLVNHIIVVVYTERCENVIRITSARKATKHEQQKFKEALTN